MARVLVNSLFTCDFNVFIQLLMRFTEAQYGKAYFNFVA